MTIFKFPLKIRSDLMLKPNVQKGDSVKKGQCLASPEAFGAKIHSSISGVVKEITDNFIAVEGEYNPNETYEKIKECKEIWEYAYEAGIVGAGGAGFPTHIKLKTQVPDGTIVANGIECEPGLEHNIKLLEDNAELVVEGVKYAMESTGATQGYIGIKAKNTQAIASTQKAIEKLKYKIQIFEAQDSYPMGEERALIHAIFDRWIAPTDLTSTLNCVVLNVETLANLTRAVKDRKPVIHKDFTVVGDFVNQETSTVFLDLPTGLSIKELTQDFKSRYDVGEVVIGGPYTGVPAQLEESYITKTSGGVIFTIPLPTYQGPLGLMVCACGANESRLKDIAHKMDAEVVGVVYCKNVAENGKCKTPGKCPGQAASVMTLKGKGAKRIMMSNCNDCSNTVMASAPKLGIGVYHATDHIFRTIHYPLSRRLKIDN